MVNEVKEAGFVNIRKYSIYNGVCQTVTGEKTLLKVEEIHDEDLKNGYWNVYLPYVIVRKYPIGKWIEMYWWTSVKCVQGINNLKDKMTSYFKQSTL